MILSLGWCLLALLFLALGGDSILKGASGLSRRFGWSPFATGLLLVAFGTSIPELAVNARAFVVGSQNLALGNAIGSNIVNFGLTLGLAAIAAPLLVRWRALAPLLICLVLATLALIALGFDGVLTRVEGLLFVVAFVVVVAIALVLGRRETPELQEELAGFLKTGDGLGLNLVRFAIGAALLYFGALWLVRHVPIVGTAWGLSPVLTGLIVVAIATALPEAVAAVSAARRGQGDIVVGHVIGSSLFNLLIVVGGMAALRDLPIPTSFVGFELPAALAASLLLYPMLRRDLQISRPEGWVLLLAFVAWVVAELLLAR
ncbi:sodium:calcium antiporter [Lysobacter hankyongensis]|uniref:Calcium/sodium antiporter n=1 Tax=Lysobacter hankyongensis TaxID=1176535 RepID=A0ABP9BMU4_9GAMM